MKRILAMIVFMGVILGIIPLVVNAQDEKNSTISVEKAIETAKSIFQIPKNYDQFDSSYDQDESRNVWLLRWYSKEGIGRVTVRVDAVSGEIVGYSFSNQDEMESYGTIPKISRKDGEKIARDLIKKAAPSKVNQITLKPVGELYQSGSSYHKYYFSRTIYGIEYPANNISVAISGQTGQVHGFSVDWDNAKYAPIAPKLTIQEAEEIIKNEYGFELQYFLPFSNGKTVKPVMPVYEIRNPYEVAIDACTGETVQNGYYYGYYDEKEDLMEESEGVGYGNPNYELEPFEEKVTDELKDLISRETALEIATKAAGVPDDYPLISSSLNKSEDLPELRIWSFDWEMEGKDLYGWASAEIDAKTGKVLAFRFNEKYPQRDNEPKIKDLKIKSKVEAEKLVESFLEANYPEVIGNIQLQTKEREIETDEDKYNRLSYAFHYERIINNIHFSQNFVRVTVNSHTGKISNFRICFFKLNFPLVDVMNQAQFTSNFLRENQMILIYTKDEKDNLRLVYQLAPLKSYRFNAQNGELIDYNGDVIKETNKGGLTGINDHWAKDDINTLYQMDYLHAENGTILPDSEMTQAEVIKALVKSTNRYIADAKTGNWYDTYYKEARQTGLIKENEVNPQAALTREELAKFITRTMGGDKFASLNIYKLDFKDAEKVSPGYIGYVAIVSGFGVITGDGTNFSPQKKCLRGETCAILVRYLNIEK